MANKPEKSMEEVMRKAGRYPPAAFAFLHEGLARAVGDIYGAQPPTGRHHVSGKQLCIALRDVAGDKWGMLAPTVLARWNIRETIDFGNMVYLLVQNKLMRKAPDDSIEDFRDVYDFASAFEPGEEFEIKE